MAKYELMYIVDGGLDEEANQAVHDRVKSILDKNVTITAEDHIGRKRFAYEIDHKNEGDYQVYNFEAESDVLTVINNELRIVEGLVRHLLIKLDD